MDQQAFVRMVGAQERSAQSHPGWYKFKLFLFAILGYAYILVLLDVSVGLLVGLIAAVIFAVQQKQIKVVTLLPLGLPLLLFSLAIIQALVVVIPEPTGMELDRGDAAPMFIEIDRIRARMGLPRFDKVIMMRDVNAAVSRYRG